MNRRTLFLASLFIIFLFLMTACTQEPVSMTLSDMQAVAADACIGVEIPVISQRLDGPIEDVAGVETHYSYYTEMVDGPYQVCQIILFDDISSAKEYFKEFGGFSLKKNEDFRIIKADEINMAFDNTSELAFITMRYRNLFVLSGTSYDHPNKPVESAYAMWSRVSDTLGLE